MWFSKTFNAFLNELGIVQKIPKNYGHIGNISVFSNSKSTVYAPMPKQTFLKQCFYLILIWEKKKKTIPNPDFYQSF